MKKNHLVFLIIFLSISIYLNVNCILNKSKKGLRISLNEDKKCPLGCSDCNYNVCTKCFEGFTFYNGKCFDNIKLNDFITDISDNMEDKQKEILSFLINKPTDNNNSKSSTYIDLSTGIL